jgi:glucose/arabinose dehydrogenase
MSRNILLFFGTLLVAALAAAIFLLRRNTGEIRQNVPTRSSESQSQVGKPDSFSDGSSSRKVNTQGELAFLTLPEGVSIGIFARNLPGARVMAFDPAGNMLVSLTDPGRVVAVRDTDGDGSADRTTVLLAGLDRPHGLAFDCTSDHCRLFVAEEGRVTRYDYDAATVSATNGRRLFDLPSGRGHATRTLLIAPAGGEKRLFVHVGSSCNVCVESDLRRATVLSADLDGGDLRTFASGLRNAVFFTTHPQTGELWATENGRDRLGDDVPPDEIDVLREGGNYGWPYCYGKNVHDDAFDPGRTHACAEPQTLPSRIDIQAHSAPLGLAFASGDGWPEGYRDNLFVAYHGSWNRSIPTGYKVVRYRLDAQGNLLDQEDFITGWLAPDGTVRGRPVDILARPDGTLYISDDRAGMIYKVIISQ